MTRPGARLTWPLRVLAGLLGTVALASAACYGAVLVVLRASLSAGEIAGMVAASAGGTGLGYVLLRVARTGRRPFR